MAALPLSGIPYIQHYFPKDYQNTGKVWDIQTAPNGLVYMASDKALLEFDGNKFRTFKGSKGVIRSLHVLNDSTLFSGSDLDFGVWRKTNTLQFSYESLYPFDEEVQNIKEEFWQIKQHGSDFYFISSTNVYIYKKNKIIKLAAPTRLGNSFFINDSLYFEDERNALFVLEDYALKPTKMVETASEILGSIRFGLADFIITKNKGIYRVKDGICLPAFSELSERLTKAQIFCYARIQGNHMAFGTVLDGVYVADLEGNILYHINKSKGLANNTILSLNHSRNGKFWIATDYGLASLNLESEIAYHLDHHGDFGAAYAALLQGDEFYLGTNQGLYYAPWQHLQSATNAYRFQLLEKSLGQVWSVDAVQGEIFVSHDKGLFKVEGRELKLISKHDGVFAVVDLNNHLLSADYNGISLYRKVNLQWMRVAKLDQIYGACKQVLKQNDSVIWVAIPNFGFVMIELNKDFKIKQKRIFEETNFDGNTFYLLMNGDSVCIQTEKFTYCYNKQNDTFLKASGRTVWNKTLQDLNFASFPRKINDTLEFFPLNNGFALKQAMSRQAVRPNALMLREITAFNNELYDTFFTSGSIPFHLNNLKIEFIIPNQDQVQYHYKLQGTSNWSDWSDLNAAVLVGLKPKNYVLEVEAKVDNIISNTLLIPFEILKPWYLRTKGLLILTFVALVLLALSVYVLKIRSKRLLGRKLALRAQDQIKKEKQKTDVEQIKQNLGLIDENEALKEKLKNKALDLNNIIRELTEKDRFIESVQQTIQKNFKDKDDDLYRELRLLFKSYSAIEDKGANQHLDESYLDFYKRLKERFPGLSMNDLRFCAYLIQGLNSKEIADILHIQPSSSYISRSRLRKKMNLKPDENLFDVLMKFK